MWQWIRAIRRDELAQDLIEYTLLLGFIAVAVIGVFLGSGQSVQGIWSSSGSTLAAASTVTASSAASSPRHHGGGSDGGDGSDSGDGH
jgi:Flp pilus assembly pilin Flp